MDHGENTIPKCINDIPGNTLNGKNIISISAGGESSAAVDSEGKVYTWGNNEDGQLGNGTNGYGITSNLPIFISDISGNILNGKNIIDISIGGALGSHHVIAIDNQGKVYTWGANSIGQLGKGTTDDSNVPICISDISGNILNGKNIVEISAGGNHTVVLDDQGKVYTWGNNSHGQLGNETNEASLAPICISDISGNILKGKNIISISAGESYTLAIDEQGKVYSWGWNRYGELGDGTDGYNVNSTSPICISDISSNILNGKKIISISAGGNSSVAVDIEGKVYTWGFNGLGQLGNGTTDDSNVPICISEIEGNILNEKNIIEVSAGDRAMIAADIQGNVYTWGYNDDGQLGNGSEIMSSTPIQIFKELINIIKDKNIVEITDGEAYSVALDNQGKIYTWGYNIFGQLGNGADEFSIVPICISEIEGNRLNGKNIIEISAGAYHTIVIDNTGYVVILGKWYSNV